MDDTANSIFGDIHNSTIIQVGTITCAGTRPEPHDEPWQRMVSNAEVWQHTNPGRDARQDAIDAAGRLAALRMDIREDPWLDRGFVERFDQRIGGLVKHKLELRLDPAEAALLALVPLLHQVLWTRAAATACGGRPEVDAGFQRDHARLLNLVRRRPDADAEIRWWLFHRWLSLRIEVVRQESVTELLTKAEFPAYLRPEWVQTLLYGLRLEPDVLCTDWVRRQKCHETLFGGAPDEQQVRLPLLGLVLSVAHAMAIEATELSETVVWHVGVPNPVRLEDLHRTLATTQWSGTTLEATCHHAAVVESLSEHLGRVNTLLHEVSKAAHRDQGLEPLRALPERVNGDGVGAAPGPDGKPMFTGWNRFNLDEQRVQELLMGEQLYRDRGLAIRELYQNALDACRYRRAREEYLFRTTGRKTDWAGSIRFEQDVDETGQPYLDCVDNGVGMGISELTGVFSRAGARFADLTEFRDEQADWERLDPPVELFPNSRFGIGVLSYFMLADEITITTCRMDRITGLPGPTLQVNIVGPGHLFHIQKVSDTGVPGTRVRLHLRSASIASCVQVLDRLLGIAEFATTARHDKEQVQWQAGRLRTRRVNRAGHRSDGELNAYGRTIANAEGTVVWCEHGGAILVDGVLTRAKISSSSLLTRDIHGVVVNLNGSASPRLSVDRRQIIDDISATVEQLVLAAIPDLVRSDDRLLNTTWLRHMASRSPRLADLIFDQWPTIRTLFLLDKELAIEARSEDPDLSIYGLQRIPDSILLWRLLALTPNNTLEELSTIVPELDEVGSILNARPSDVIVLTGSTNHPPSWPRVEEITSFGHVFETAHLSGLSPRTVAHRLAELGFNEVDPHRYPDKFSPGTKELMLLRSHNKGRTAWLSPKDPLPVRHISTVSTALHISAKEALDFLVGHGFAPPPTVELLLRSQNIDGRPPWLTPSEPVPIPHIIKAASTLDMTIEAVCGALRQLDLEPGRDNTDWLDDASARELHEVCDDLNELDIGDVVAVARSFGISVTEAGQRLGQLGLEVPAVPQSLARVDLRLLSRHLNYYHRPWLRRNQPVPPHHFLRAHWKYGVNPRQVADQLGELGYDPVLREQQPEDFMLLADVLGKALIDPYEPVTLARLIVGGRRLSMPITRVAERLRELGIEVPDVGDLIRAALAKVPRPPADG